MLEDLFVDPAAEERLRSCLFGTHLDALSASFVALGYRRFTIRQKLWTVRDLSRWMRSKHLGIADLDEQRVGEFVRAQRRRGRRCRGIRPTSLQLLALLRAAGAVTAPAPTDDGSPGAALLARYEEYLRRERGLCASTVTSYRRFASPFVDKHLEGKAAGPDCLRPIDVRDFLLARVPVLSPKRAQALGSALRSFLGFLFLRGATGCDLSLAVPTVRRAYQVSVPRHLPPEEVEQLLGACNLASATGRRDHAILLLLAQLGLRAGEVMALQLEDLRWREGEVIVRGKGLIHDRLPLPTDVGEAISRYLQSDRPAGPSRHVFICRKAPHRGLSHPSSVTTIVMRALERAGLTPPTRGAHLLRHSLATTMVRRGASLAEVGQVLRHRSPSTTEIYAKVDFGALRDVARPWPLAGGAR